MIARRPRPASASAPSGAVAADREPVRARPGWLRRGVGSGLVGALAFAGTVMLIAEIAAEPTPVDGVRSSTWTPITAIATVVLGDDAFSGSWAFPEIVVGLALILAGGAVLGLLGGWFIRASLGPRPEPWLAMGLGAFYGLCAVIAIFATIFAATGDLIYHALPNWGWWVGMGAYGIALALAEVAWGRST